MTKIYTKNTWTDEVLADTEKYQVKNDSGAIVYDEAEISVSTPVVTPGTPVNASRMNNIEDGLDAVDTLLDTVNGLVQTTGIAKVRESGGPTTLSVGSVPDATFLHRSGSGIVGKTIAETVALLLSAMRTALNLDTFQITMAGGNLIASGASGIADAGEIITTPNNLLMFKVNKFEKGEVGNSELHKAPSAWNLSTVTAKLKHVDVGGNVINNCDVAWDAAQGANSVCSADTSVKLEGTGSAKCALNASATTGLVMTDVVTSVDLRNAKWISFWIRSSVALSAGDFRFSIDDTAACASPVATWNIPAIPANTWTKVQLDTSTPQAGAISGASAIISIGLNQVVDKGAMDINIDQVCWQGTVTWLLSAIAISAGESFDVAQGTKVEISGDVKFYEDAEVTFPTMTIGGSPAAGDRLVFAITRKNNASDTHGAGKVCFAGCEIVMTRA